MDLRRSCLKGSGGAGGRGLVVSRSAARAYGRAVRRRAARAGRRRLAVAARTPPLPEVTVSAPEAVPPPGMPMVPIPSPWADMSVVATAGGGWLIETKSNALGTALVSQFLGWTTGHPRRRSKALQAPLRTGSQTPRAKHTQRACCEAELLHLVGSGPAVLVVHVHPGCAYGCMPTIREPAARGYRVLAIGARNGQTALGVNHPHSPGDSNGQLHQRRPDPGRDDRV
jgi:hypothetical protein